MITRAQLLARQADGSGKKPTTTIQLHAAVLQAIREQAGKISVSNWIVERLLADPKLYQRAAELAEQQEFSAKIGARAQ